MRRLLPLLVLTLLIPSYTFVVIGDSGRSINVDLDVDEISITRPDSKSSLYQIFSSNYPIIGFDKSESLYVTDGVVGVEININIEIKSGLFNPDMLTW